MRLQVRILFGFLSCCRTSIVLRLLLQVALHLLLIVLLFLVESLPLVVPPPVSLSPTGIFSRAGRIFPLSFSLSGSSLTSNLCFNFRCCSSGRFRACSQVQDRVRLSKLILNFCGNCGGRKRSRVEGLGGQESCEHTRIKGKSHRQSISI